MSYRKITVNDKQYEYVIGKTNTKIKGVGLFLNSQVGSEVVDCGGNFIEYVVTLRIVATLIKGSREKPTFSCHHGTVTDKLMVNPYDEEIYGKTLYIAACGECYNTLAGEI